MNLTAHPELASRLAAAYALGTLRGPARRRFEQMARANPTLRANALVWQEHFAAMLELEPPQQPSENVWKRIAIDISNEPKAAAATGRGATTPSGAEGGIVDAMRRRMALWRRAALATSFAAIAAIGIALQFQARPEIRYVAVLADEKQAPAMLVTFDPDRSMLTVKRMGAFSEGSDRSLQLWALPPGRSPESLGVLPAGTVMRMPAPEARVRSTPAIAVSLEPKGGAPAGSGPTGPVLFKGAVVEML